jgi:hypothetical protein
MTDSLKHLKQHRYRGYFGDGYRIMSGATDQLYSSKPASLIDWANSLFIPLSQLPVFLLDQIPLSTIFLFLQISSAFLLHHKTMKAVICLHF